MCVSVSARGKKEEGTFRAVLISWSTSVLSSSSPPSSAVPSGSSSILSSSFGGLSSFFLKLMPERRRRPTTSSRQTTSSCVKYPIRHGLLVQSASPPVPSVAPFEACWKTRLMREVKISGMPLRGSVVEEPPEKVEAQGSLSPGTNTNVVAAVRAGKSARREASWSKYSIIAGVKNGNDRVCRLWGRGYLYTRRCLHSRPSPPS